MNKLMPIPPVNPLYVEMERLLTEHREEINRITGINAALMAERNIFEDRYREAYNDQIRLQQIVATLHGRLQAIGSVIADAIQEAVRNGVEATQRAEQGQQREDQPAGASGSTLPPNELMGLSESNQVYDGADQRQPGAANQP